MSSNLSFSSQDTPRLQPSKHGDLKASENRKVINSSLGSSSIFASNLDLTLLILIMTCKLYSFLPPLKSLHEVDLIHFNILSSKRLLTLLIDKYMSIKKFCKVQDFFWPLKVNVGSRTLLIPPAATFGSINSQFVPRKKKSKLNWKAKEILCINLV